MRACEEDRQGGWTKAGKVRDCGAWTCRINVPWKGGALGWSQLGNSPVYLCSSNATNYIKGKKVLGFAKSCRSAICNKVAELEILVL